MRIASDGLPFILPPAIAAAACVAAGWPWSALALLTATASITAFFRDPERSSDAPEGHVLSPADGRVIHARTEADGTTFVAIFLSLLDVHVARSPVAGELVHCRRLAGGFAPAFQDRASRNARVELGVATPAGHAQVSLMAGLVARRVLPWVSAPTELRRGQRVAIIRFGSRSEVRLPRGFSPAVTAGERVRAGESIIARPRTSSQEK